MTLIAKPTSEENVSEVYDAKTMKIIFDDGSTENLGYFLEAIKTLLENFR